MPTAVRWFRNDWRATVLIREAIMNKALGTCATVAIALLCGCATPRYIISTNDGTMIQAKGEPKLNTATDMYEYRDLNGQDGAIRHADVKQILKQ
jgi:hypothetical protein